MELCLSASLAHVRGPGLPCPHLKGTRAEGLLDGPCALQHLPDFLSRHSPSVPDLVALLQGGFDVKVCSGSWCQLLRAASLLAGEGCTGSQEQGVTGSLSAFSQL